MSIEPQHHTSDRTRAGWAAWASFCVLGAGLAWLAYRGMAGQTFLLLWDDGDVLKNPMIQGLDWESLRWMVATFEGSNWKPLTWLSLALDHALWGENALGYKLHNLLLHALSSILVALLIERLVGDALRRSGRSTEGLRAAALAAGLLFLVHPQHVESVVWISERKDVLFALFYLGALYAHVRATQAPQARAWPELTKLAAFLSMLSKPMAISLPVALVLIDLYHDRPRGARETWRSLRASVRRNAVVFLMAAVVAWIITQAVENTDLPTPLGLAARVANACFAVLFYVYGFFLPFDLSTYYQFPEWILSLSWVAAGPPLVLLGGGAMTVAAWRRGHRAPLLLLLFAGAALLPASGIKQVILLTYADRFAYIPGLPLYLAFALALVHLQRRVRWRVLGPVVLALLSLLAVEASRHVAWWRDDEAMWRRVLERDPGRVALAYHRLASLARTRGEPVDGLLRAALDAEPWNPSAQLDLAAHLIANGQTDEALPLLEAMSRNRPDAKLHMIQAIRLLLLVGKPDLAQEAAQRALEAHPGNRMLLIENARVKGRLGVALSPGELERWAAAVGAGRYDREAARELAGLSGAKGVDPASLVQVWRALVRNPSLQLSDRGELAWVFQQLALVELGAGMVDAAMEDLGRSLAHAQSVSMGLVQVGALAGQSRHCEALGHLVRVQAMLPFDAAAFSRGDYYPREFARLRSTLEADAARQAADCVNRR